MKEIEYDGNTRCIWVYVCACGVRVKTVFFSVTRTSERTNERVRTFWSITLCVHYTRLRLRLHDISRLIIVTSVTKSLRAETRDDGEFAVDAVRCHVLCSSFWLSAACSTRDFEWKENDFLFCLRWYAICAFMRFIWRLLFWFLCKCALRVNRHQVNEWKRTLMTHRDTFESQNNDWRGANNGELNSLARKG